MVYRVSSLSFWSKRAESPNFPTRLRVIWEEDGVGAGLAHRRIGAVRGNA